MFQRATRKKSRLRLALCGPSGSGKTYSALAIAQGIAQPIAVIDTERGSASLYADMAEFDVMELSPPFAPAVYVQAIREAEKAGYPMLIIDSLSHAWEGEGGVLDMHEKATKAQRSQNSYTAWRNVTPKHNELVTAIIQSPMHIIATLRTKTAYEVQENDRGKKAPVKIGTKPIQREGIEYEFTTVFDMSIENVATASKDRTSLFVDAPHVPDRQTGARLNDWLNQGDEVEPDVPRGTLEEQLKAIEGQCAEAIVQKDVDLSRSLLAKGFVLLRGVERDSDEYTYWTGVVENVSNLVERIKKGESDEK